MILVLVTMKTAKVLTTLQTTVTVKAIVLATVTAIVVLKNVAS
jgi:hypothetical protein